jgi:glucosamine-6-phosphate deaminase
VTICGYRARYLISESVYRRPLRRQFFAIRELWMIIEDQNTKGFRLGKARVELYPSRKAMGAAAAKAVAGYLGELAREREQIGVIFATGASQIETLDALTRMEDLPWDKIVGFHMDEYVGLPIEHPASFRKYLRERLIHKVPMKEFFEVDGNAPDLDKLCRFYTEKLRALDPQVCILGIGENGHLAFNDPGVADFNDPLDVKVVDLDLMCQAQQVAEGWFGALEEVPKQAVTLTIPALIRVPHLVLSVPGERKAEIMRQVVQEDEISTRRPASILRNHPGATIYLDPESAKLS